MQQGLQESKILREEEFSLRLEKLCSPEGGINPSLLFSCFCPLPTFPQRLGTVVANAQWDRINKPQLPGQTKKGSPRETEDTGEITERAELWQSNHIKWFMNSRAYSESLMHVSDPKTKD